MLKEILEAFKKAVPNPEYEDKLIVMKLLTFLNKKVDTIKEIKAQDEVIVKALDKISRDQVCNELISLSKDITMDWLSQFNTIDLFEMLHKIKNQNKPVLIFKE